jgi:hypothetical protein
MTSVRACSHGFLYERSMSRCGAILDTEIKGYETEKSR